MKQLIVLFLIGGSLFTFHAKADSPLTSTNFSKAYTDHKRVKYAAEKGLDAKILKFLTKGKTDDVIKIAIINKLGWGDKGRVKTFETYLLEKRKGLSPKTFNLLRENGLDEFVDNAETRSLTADDLMCWAYLQALENYFEPHLAYTAASVAYDREPKSMAHATVYALITAQVIFDSDWCAVYQTGKIFFEDAVYSKNMLSKAAIEIIMNYLRLYQDSCV